MVFYTKSIYWFRRDLRVHDNKSLAKTYEESDEIIAVYVFDKKLLADMSSNAFYLSFLINAVKDLAKKINLNLFCGELEDVFENLLSRYKCNVVYTAKPLSWSERLVADRVYKVCQKLGVRYVEVLDNVLSNSFHEHPLINFTTYYKSWLKNLSLSFASEVPRRKFIPADGLELNDVVSKLDLKPLGLEHANIDWGRKRLGSFKFEQYGKIRDYPYLDGVSRLSHFINLGVLSIREVCSKAMRSSQDYIRQLAWREYYFALWHRYPWINELELKEYMRSFEWENNRYHINCFTEGKTGYPIVDAGIRQLMKEGWIHNRVRLIVANFLVKDLHVDWRIGANFFKNKLIDYDEVLNTGNWQWVASAGVDPLPLRVFNPIKQAEKYDPLCVYIKKYIPELADVDCRALHNPLSYKIKGYYEPIVDHYEAVKKFSDHVRKKIAEWRSKRPG